MTEDTTAPALVGEAMPADAPVEAISTPEMTEDELLDQAYDNAQTAEEAGDETPEPAAEAWEAESEPAAKPVKAPPFMSAEHNAIWADLTEAQREVVSGAYRSITSRSEELGRQVKGLGPIRDALADMAEKLPSLKNLTPEQAVASIGQVAQWGERLASDFDGAMAEIYRAHGREYTPGQPAAQGKNAPTALEQANATLQREIAAMKQQMQQVSNPDFISSQISQQLAQDRLQTEIANFAASKEHWAQVEGRLQFFAPAAREDLGEGASPVDVLSAAYDMAVAAYVRPQAQNSVAPAATPKADPAKAKAAKALNVSSDAPAKGRTLTEDQLLDQAWAKHNP